MKYSEAKCGRTFILRLDLGEDIVETLERFAREHAIQVASFIVVGAAQEGSVLRVGAIVKEDGKPGVLTRTLEGGHEMTGTGTLVRDDKGITRLHMHAACGRDGTTFTGCVGKGMRVGRCLEVIVSELVDTKAVRAMDPDVNCKLLIP